MQTIPLPALQQMIGQQMIGPQKTVRAQCSVCLAFFALKMNGEMRAHKNCFPPKQSNLPLASGGGEEVHRDTDDYHPMSASLPALA